MSVDVFGRKLDKKEGVRGPPGIGYKITEEGNFDCDNKRICNVAHPQDLNDAVNMDFFCRLLDAELRNVKKTLSEMNEKIEIFTKFLTEGHNISLHGISIRSGN